MLVRWFLCVALAVSGLCAAPLAYAQTSKAVVVATCGTAPNGYNPSSSGNGYSAGGVYPIVEDVNGNLCTNAGGGGGGGTSSTYGAAFPATGTAIGVKNGANMVNLTADGSGNLNVNIAAGGASGANIGATGSAVPASINYNGLNNGGTAIGEIGDATGRPIVAMNSGACATGCIVDLATAQGGAIAGIKGTLAMGSVTTSAPTYTNAQTSPLNLDTAGNLRVNVAAGSTGNACATVNTGSAVPAPACFIGGGAAAGAGNLTGATVKAGSTVAAPTDTGLGLAPLPTGNNTAATPTVTAAAYTTNQCIGGFQALTLSTAATRIATFSISSKTGLTGNKIVFFFNANPTSSTCTDHGAFTLNTADLSKQMNMGGLNIAPQTQAGQTPTGATASLDFPIPQGGAVWVAVVEGTTGETLGSTSEFVENVGVE